MTIRFAKVRVNGIIPSKREEDGWYDIYADNSKEYEIKPNEIKLIPTAIASAFDKGYRIKLAERGSNTKSQLNVRAGCIDSGYRGEWFVALYNGYVKDVVITGRVKDVVEDGECLMVPIGKAICQAGVEVVPESQVMEVSYEELLRIESERGDGCLGSSGK